MTSERHHEPPRGFIRTAGRLLRTMGADRGRVSAIGVIVLFVVGFNVAVPRLLGRATDTVIDGIGGDGVDFGRVGQLLGVAALCALAAALLTMTQGRIIASIVQRMGYRLRQQLDAKLGRLPLRFVDGQQRGELVSRATNDVDNVTQTLQMALNRQLVSVMLIVGVPLMMLSISPLLTVVVLATVPVTLATARAIGRRAQRGFDEQWAAVGALTGHVEEAYTGHALIAAFGRQQTVVDEFGDRNREVARAASGAAFHSGFIAPALTFLGNVNYVLVAVVGGLRVASGALSIGEIQAFIQYVLQFNQPITGTAATASQLQSAVASAARVFELLDAPEETADPAPSLSPPLGAAPAIAGHVVFDDVSFRYRVDEPLIDGFRLDVPAGATVAIVGPTGAGKTTLVNLLMRFYELDGGRITVDGVDVAGIGRGELRHNVGMVLQDTWLFGGTIADNIAFGDPDASREQVIAAAAAARADAFIRMLPDGYDTVIGDDGDGLSAGERQLLTIARAFLIEPAILVLDEATSSVDTRTEMLIQQATAALRRGRTSFVIAHRLSTIRDADTVVVMDRGRIVETGTHDELVDAGGTYAGLYAAQSLGAAA